MNYPIVGARATKVSPDGVLDIWTVHLSIADSQSYRGGSTSLSVKAQVRPDSTCGSVASHLIADAAADDRYNAKSRSPGVPEELKSLLSDLAQDAVDVLVRKCDGPDHAAELAQSFCDIIVARSIRRVLAAHKPKLTKEQAMSVVYEAYLVEPIMAS